MLNKFTTVYSANSVADAQLILKNIAGISIIAGGTEIARRQTGRSLHLPANVLALSQIPELKTMSKTERYVEFGPSVTLSSILQLGKKNVPDVLYDAISTIANPAVRSLATLGGNVSAKGQRLATFAPLLALDARLEIRTATDAYWTPMARYFTNTGRDQPKTPEFIDRLRIPTENWDIALYRRIGHPGIVTDATASFVFLVKSEKNILSDIRIAYAGKFFFRKREFENLIIGRSLPLDAKDVSILLDKAEIFFSPALFPPSFERTCLFNLLEDALRMLL